MGGGLKVRKVALVNLSFLWISPEAGSSHDTGNTVPGG